MRLAIATALLASLCVGCGTWNKAEEIRGAAHRMRTADSAREVELYREILTTKVDALADRRIKQLKTKENDR